MKYILLILFVILGITVVKAQHYTFTEGKYSDPIGWQYTSTYKENTVTNLVLSQTRKPANSNIEAWKAIGIYTTSITLNAIGDALNDKGEKEWGHACNALSIGTLLVQPFVSDINKHNWWKYLASYTFLRAAMFDPIYNKTRGLSINYYGNSAITDKFQQKFGAVGIFPERTLFLIMGVSIPLKEFRK